MAAHDGEKTGFDKWADGLKNAVTDSKWNMYDCEVKSAVNEFNRHLKGTAGYRPLDWRLIKAMLWVETGAGHAQWRTNPIQIGVAGDPGLQAFLADDGAGPMILPANWSGKIRVATARINPSHGIRAGVGYLLMRAARFEHQSVYHSDSKMYQVTVHRGDSFARIAKQQGTTIEILHKLNPRVTALRPDEVLTYRKGAIQRVIQGWQTIDVRGVARLYNGGGDPNYARKLEYAYGLTRRSPEALCE